MSMKNSGRPRRAVHHPADGLALDHRVGRAGRGDDDVHRGQRGRQLVEGHGRPRQRPRQLLGARPGAVGDVERERALLDEVPGGQLAHLARADEENGPADEPGEDLLRQLDGGERDRHRVPRDLRLRPHLLRHGEGLREQRVERGPDRLARLGERERVLHLPEDLRLAEHHRVEARGDAERVAHGLALGVGVEHRLDARPSRRRGDGRDAGTSRRAPRPAPRRRRTPRPGCRSTGSAPRGPRRSRRCRGAPRAACPRRPRAARAAPPERCDARRRRRRAASYPPCLPGRNSPAPSVSASAANPRIAKYAARRPCQPPTARPARVAA